MRFVAWFQIVIGVAVAGLWTVLLATGQVSEVQEGRVDIWFHIAAELVMAGLLLAAGVAVADKRADLGGADVNGGVQNVFCHIDAPFSFISSGRSSQRPEGCP
jgi:hypothetical protein